MILQLVLACGFVLSGRSDPAKTYDYGRLEYLRSLTGQPGQVNQVNSLAFSQDGSLIFGASFLIKKYDMTTGGTEAVLPRPRGSNGYVWSLTFSRDGQTVATGSQDGKIQIWDVKSGKQKKTFEDRGVPVLSVAFSQDGSTLAAGCGDNGVRLWDFSAGKLKNTWRGHSSPVAGVAFSPDGAILASGSGDSTIILWDARTGEIKKTIPNPGGRVNTLLFSKVGWLYCGSADGSIERFYIPNGAVNNSYGAHPLLMNPYANDSAYGQGYALGVSSIAISPDESAIVASDYMGSVTVYDSLWGTPLKSLDNVDGCVGAVAFSPDGSTIACGTRSGTIKFWRAPVDPWSTMSLPDITKWIQDTLKVQGGFPYQRNKFHPDENESRMIVTRFELNGKTLDVETEQRERGPQEVNKFITTTKYEVNVDLLQTNKGGMIGVIPINDTWNTARILNFHTVKMTTDVSVDTHVVMEMNGKLTEARHEAKKDNCIDLRVSPEYADSIMRAIERFIELAQKT